MVLAVLAAAAAVAAAPPPPKLALKPCLLQGSVAASCGTLTVPEDRTKPAGRKVRVFVGVVRAYGPRPHAEPIFWLSGGPGGAAAGDDAKFASSVFFAANKKRDLVLVDQRGVGRSTPLLCPAVPAELSEAEARAFVQQCLASVGHDVRFFTTDAAMDDVDAVRAALGYRKVVVYGGSYGATAAQVYLARHGAHVRAAVLDSGTLLGYPIFERWAAASQRAFDALVARCDANARCHAAFPDVRGDLAAAVRAMPDLDVPGVVHQALRDPAAAAEIPRLLHAAATGDTSDLEDLASVLSTSGLDTNRLLMAWSIMCGEGWARFDPAEVARAGAGSYLLEDELASARRVGAVCSLLPAPLASPDAGATPTTRVPILFLVGGMDPQDPLENVADAKQTMPNATILVAPGAGHGVAQHGCMAAVVTRFFATLRVAAADRACAASVRPPPFATP